MISATVLRNVAKPPDSSAILSFSASSVHGLTVSMIMTPTL
jgi:hypothetical protein